MAQLAQLTPVFDVLRRRRPDLVSALSARYPELESAFEGHRKLGTGESVERQTADAATEIATASLFEAKHDLNDVLGVLTKRTKILARLRLAGGLISSISSVGMIAALAGSNFKAQMSSAIVAFASSTFVLLTGYIEDFSGGDGSVRRLRELMTTQVRRLAEIDGQMKSAFALNDKGKILSGLTEISAVLGEVQYARAQLGLPI